MGKEVCPTDRLGPAACWRRSPPSPGASSGIAVGAFVANIPSNPARQIANSLQFLACGGMIVHGLYNLASFRKRRPHYYTEVVKSEPGDRGTDFAERRCRLESYETG